MPATRASAVYFSSRSPQPRLSADSLRSRTRIYAVDTAAHLYALTPASGLKWSLRRQFEIEATSLLSTPMAQCAWQLVDNDIATNPAANAQGTAVIYSAAGYNQPSHADALTTAGAL